MRAGIAQLQASGRSTPELDAWAADYDQRHAGDAPPPVQLYSGPPRNRRERRMQAAQTRQAARRGRKGGRGRQ